MAAVRIDSLRVATRPQAWRECGFEVDERGVAKVGSVALALEESGEPGITGWSLRDAAATDLDGLPTTAAPGGEPPLEVAARHPNTAVRIDHLVAFTPDLKRTVGVLEGAGLDLRRLRDPTEPGPPVRQAFFRLGEVILEVAEAPGADDGPASFWGITFRVADIDACARLFGERMGEVRDAVQPGRRIATARRDAGLGLPVAFISERSGGDRSPRSP